MIRRLPNAIRIMNSVFYSNVHPFSVKTFKRLDIFCLVVYDHEVHFLHLFFMLCFSE